MEENTKFCEKCGNKVHLEAVICPKCGTQLEELKSAKKEENPQIIINNSNNNVNTNMNVNRGLLRNAING